MERADQEAVARADMPRRTGAAIACIALVLAPGAAAHPEPLHGASGWNPDPLILLLGASAGLYSLGLGRMWRRAGAGRGARWWQAAAYTSGLGALVIALVSPLDAMSAELSSAHMVQHMILMVVAAPLLVLARPLPVFLWVLAGTPRRRLGAAGQSVLLRRSWQAITAPLAAWAFQAIGLWLWHMPPFYEAALRNRWLHDLEHATFFGTALLFWWATMRALRLGGMPAGLAALALLTTIIHSGFLAALITFAQRPWYRSYGERPLEWGLTPLEDQQLAGLIMWGPAAIAYLGAALAILAVWLARMESASDALARVPSPQRATSNGDAAGR